MCLMHLSSPRSTMVSCFFVSTLVFQKPCVGPACIEKGLLIGLPSHGWRVEALKRPFVRSVWDGTSIVGRSEQLRVDAGESWRLPTRSGCARSLIHLNTERSGWYVGTPGPYGGDRWVEERFGPIAVTTQVSSGRRYTD